MKTFETTIEAVADSKCDEILDKTGMYTGGDMMVLDFGRCSLETIVYGSKAYGLDVVILEYNIGDNIMFIGDLEDSFDFSEREFIKAVGFDNIEEAKVYMLQRASEGMSIDSHL